MQNDAQEQIDNLQQQITDLTHRFETHNNDGFDSPRIQLETIFGLFETVSAVPANIPNNIFDQIKIYVNGATLRFYWYDFTNNVWHYVTATA